MNKDPMQSIASSLKLLAGMQILPAILFSILLIVFMVDQISSQKRRAYLEKPVAYPIRMAGKPIPEKYSSVKPVSLEFEGMTDMGSTCIINLRLLNPTDQPVVYVVRSGSNPFHLIQTKKNGYWADHKIGWFICGNSQRQTVFINSKESTLTSVEVEKDLFPIKIGMEYANGDLAEQTVWSEPIELDQVRERRIN